MQQSFSYYITLWVIKTMGIKKIFSTDPIDYIELRKTDVYIPKSKFYKKNECLNFDVLKTKITEVKQEHIPNKLVIFVHGGAFVSGPCQHHWDSIEKIVSQTNCCVWLCNYPKAPESNILEINQNIDAVYTKAIKKFKAENIILLGDSAGGSLILTLTQRLLQKNEILPSKVIAISPVVDATFSNPKINEVDKKDIMLSKKGVLSAKKLTIGNTNLNEKTISPINSSFVGFPKLYLFFAENDITFPDQELLLEKLKSEDVTYQHFIGKNMPHIWPLLPVMYEAKLALNKIIDIINEN